MSDTYAQSDPEGLAAMYGMQPKVAPEFGNVLDRVVDKFPAIKPWVNTFAVQRGPESSNVGGGYLEFYPPWEEYNPNPGRTTFETYGKQSMEPKAITDAVAGDSLHLLGSVDPRSGQPVDADYHAMKQKLIGSLTPEQLQTDRTAYGRAQAQGDHRNFDDWMQESRGDAYVRGKLTPDKDDNWRDVYTPNQTQILTEMYNYLQKPR
jgi:hypothetical protein